MLDGVDSGAQGAVESGNGLPESFIPNQGREPAVEKDAATPPESAKDTETTKGEDESKPNKGGFTRKLEKRDAEIAELRRQLAERNAATEPKTEKQPQAVEGRPKLDDFETYDEYYEALADFKLEQREKAKESASKQEALRKENETRDRNYLDKAIAFMEQNPDYDEAVAGMPEMSVSQVQAIKDSDMPADIVYYLAKNPDEADKALSMNLMQFTRYIGRLENKLEKQTDTESGVKTPEVKITKAAPPITPVRKGSTVSTKDPGDMPLDEYVAWKRSRKG